ncbi:hypothetical protein MHYP_G00059460 [Metynnis hypsauchen]
MSSWSSNANGDPIVEISFNSNTPCAIDSSTNYTSKIIFTCQKSTELGSPVMIRQQDCMYMFEWATPVVCSETVSAQGCSLKVPQLQYTFNLSALSGVVQVRCPSSSYKINLASARQ